MKSSSPATTLVSIFSLLRLLRTNNRQIRSVSAFTNSFRYQPPITSSYHSSRNRRTHNTNIILQAKSRPFPITTRCNMPFTYNILSEQNATTTNAIIEHYGSSSDFLSLSKSEGEGILQRDDEDASKLQKGIDIAKDKGVLDPNFVPEDYITIDVLGKNPDQVADEILGTVRKSEGGSGGGVVVLCGLSGTGKVS